MQSYQTKLEKLSRKLERDKKLQHKREQFADDVAPPKKKHPWRINPACSKQPRIK